MTDVEDLLRSAAKQKAAEIGPDSIRPLDVAELAGGRARGRRQLPLARWPRLAIPLAAALAVVAVAALSIALPRVLTGRGAVGGSIAPASLPATGDAGTIPLYYVAISGEGSNNFLHPLGITVRSTMTGAALATVKLPTPHDTVSLVARGDGDDTFIVGLQPWRSPAEHSNNVGDPASSSVTLMLLHFHPSTKSVSFSPLPSPTLSDANLQSLALSPDGSQLALAVQSSPTVLDLDVYSLTGGGVRTWSLRGAAAAQWSVDIPNADQGDGGGANPNAMSWLPDGRTLAFDLSEFDGTTEVAETVRELDVDGPSGGLLADSGEVFALDPRTAPFECLDALELSADGTTVTCAGYESESYSAKASAKAGPTSAPVPSAAITTGGLDEATYGFGVFTVATGRLIAVKDPTALGDPLPVNPRLFWQGEGTLIGTLSGPIIMLSGGEEHITPWDVAVVVPQAGSVNVAW
jgi:hypothetical protein